MCTQIGVDSSSRFPFRLRTDRHTKSLITQPKHRLRSARVIMSSNYSVLTTVRHVINILLSRYKNSFPSTGGNRYDNVTKIQTVIILFSFVNVIVTPPQLGEQIIVISASVCLSVCLSAIISHEPHAQTSPNFLHVSVARSFWQHIDTLCTSGFVDVVACVCQ